MALDALADGDAPIRPSAGMTGGLGPLFRLVRDQRIVFPIVVGMNTVIAGATVIGSWFAHRGFSSRRSADELGGTEQQQAQP